MSNSIKRTAIIISIISLSTKLLGFAREVFLAYFFGTTYVVDAYLMASGIPGVLFGWLTASAVAVTPIYILIREKDGLKKSNEYLNYIISFILSIGLLCVIGSLFFSEKIVYIVASGFSGDTLDVSIKYFKISIWTILLTAPIQILIAYLNCSNRFVSANISTLALSSVQIIFIIIAGLWNSYLLIFGIVFSYIIQIIILTYFSNKNGYKFGFKLRIDENIKKTLYILFPIFTSSMITQINSFVDKSFASGLDEGSISALNYGLILQGFIFTVFTIALTTMIYPMLSQAVAEKKYDKLKSLFSKATNIIILLFVPLTIGAILLAKPAISVVFQRGEFDATSAAMTVSAFIMYSIGLLALALRDVITKVFYSMQDTISTLLVSAFAVGLNIVLNFTLVGPMGHAGLALATSLSAIISIPLFFIILRKKIGSMGLMSSLILFIKAAIATAIMGVIVYFADSFMSGVLGEGKIGLFISLVVSAGLGGLAYFGLMVAMKVKEMEYVTDIFKGFLVKFKRK